jgi:predicted TIM-barrel fold metal-dependent hydrolase
MEAVIGEMLEIAPVTKICYSSDARFMPEGFYLAATWARRAVGLSLERSIQGGELTLNEALKAAARILKENSEGLYGVARSVKGES